MVVDDGEIPRDGSASKNHDSVYEPVTIYGTKKTYCWVEKRREEGVARTSALANQDTQVMEGHAMNL